MQQPQRMHHQRQQELEDQQQEPLLQQHDRQNIQLQDEPVAVQQNAVAPVAAEPQQQVRENRGQKRRRAAPQDEEEQIRRQRERERLKALSRDRRSVNLDKARHGFYNVIKAFVDISKSTGKTKAARDAIKENTPLTQSFQMAYDKVFAMRMQAEDNGTIPEFEEKYGAYEAELQVQYQEMRTRVRNNLQQENPNATQEEYERELSEEMQSQPAQMEMGRQQRANVVGGTKPAAMQRGQDGSRWLVKEAVSCIGVNEPNAALVTEAGYKVQKLVNPDTAIEAYHGLSVGKGVVSYQRMVEGVKQDEVDLFRFSRTPESMTQRELDRIQELSPQILREHTSDWLLCNFDTKGENFLVANDGTGDDRLYGIDKEAAFRPILDEGAQKMSKDYCRFDQNTVYNRIFQKFADGSMDLDLNCVQAQVERVEAMGDDEYLRIFNEYLHQQEETRPNELEQIRTNIMRRKQNLRMEYREFFTNLVKERCTKLPDAEAAALKTRYFGAENGNIFLFENEGPEVLEAERQKKLMQRSENQAELDMRVQKADLDDEKTYKRRHAMYDFSKSIVMGCKKHFARQGNEPDANTTTIAASELAMLHGGDREDVIYRSALTQVRQMDGLNQNDVLNEQQQRRVEEICAEQRAYLEQYDALVQEAVEQVQQENGLGPQDVFNEQQQQRMEAIQQEKLQRQNIPLQMLRQHDVHLGGTKPMAEFFGSDGSRWLSKQAVNCMGYYKKEGVILTEAGAKLQKLVDPATAVDAFAGKTATLGEVSFQRRLENVEHGAGKLDLFKFSKHPEMATMDTIEAVEKIGDQILREHITDWLLCNFDTKGENFVVTIEDEKRVLHGIDKEAAFNKILKPEAQHMSRTYKPHSNDTLYNVVFTMYANNEMNLDLFSMFPQMEKIQTMDDDAYMETYQGYLENLQETEKADKYQKTRDNILRRKTNLKEDYRIFFTQLVLERCEKLHPDEAEQLKSHYFGAGDSFKFPGE